MSIFEDDGFVIVDKEGLDAEDDADVVSVSSSKSSLCLVGDPPKSVDSVEDAVDEEPSSESSEPASQAAEAAPAVKAPPPAPASSLLESSSEAVPKKQPKYVCSGCSCDVAAQADLVWEGFMGANKAAFLFSKVLNTEASGEARKQQLSTGLFLLQDVHCKTCAVPLGWSYLKAWNQEQKYKEGSTIVQQSLLQLEGEPSAQS